jgi:membrane protein
MQEQHQLSPEARRRRLAATHARFGPKAMVALLRRPDGLEVIKRVAVGVYNDGFIHAGNLAYLAMVSLFPFFILSAAMARLLGRGADTELVVATILSRLPPGVAEVLAGPIGDVLEARSGGLLWFGALVGLWTAASFIETIRDILRRAYGVKYSAPFWEYRLGSLALILVAVLVLMAAFSATVFLTSFHHFMVRAFPFSQGLGADIGLYRFIIPGLTLFGTIYALILFLTPSRYRKSRDRKWPGALLITVWWMAMLEALPFTIGLCGGYDLTYGSLAGVMVTMLFFFVIGLGVVTGAELNAALAEPGDKALEGETYKGPYVDDLAVEAPAPDEAVRKDAADVTAGGGL